MTSVDDRRYSEMNLKMYRRLLKSATRLVVNLIGAKTSHTTTSSAAPCSGWRPFSFAFCDSV